MKYKGLYIWIAIPVIVIIAWVPWYTHLSTEIQAKEKELAAIKDEARKVDTDIRAVLEMKRKEESIRLSLREFQGQIPVFDNFPDFMKDVAAIARKDGLAIDKFSGTFNSIDLKQKTILTYPIFDIGVKGTFMEIGKFIEHVGNIKAYRRIVKGSLSYTEKEYPLLLGRFEIEFKAWKERGAFESQ